MFFVEYFSPNADQKVKENNANYITNCLKLIEVMLDKTEEIGLGKLKPHGSILKGERVTINFTID